MPGLEIGMAAARVVRAADNQRDETKTTTRTARNPQRLIQATAESTAGRRRRAPEKCARSRSPLLRLVRARSVDLGDGRSHRA